MKLSDLEKYNRIAVQVHNDPDADAVGSAMPSIDIFSPRVRT